MIKINQSKPHEAAAKLAQPYTISIIDTFQQSDKIPVTINIIGLSTIGEYEVEK